MPELPDVIAYVEALQSRLPRRRLESIMIVSPFVLRTVEPAPDEFSGKLLLGVSRIGKRIVLEFERELFAVFHPMIAGRLRWLARDARLPAKITLAGLKFENGWLALTEAASKKRAALHLLRGQSAADVFRSNALDPLNCSAAAFAARVESETHTLKRTLTDPRLFDGIGNAYSDEILHAARLSPIALSTKLSAEQVESLRIATRDVLTHWIDRLRRQFAERFPGPGEITAFRPEFAVHGKFGQPCPRCASAVERIRYAENETNYCPRCQTGGRVLADRSLSRLLRDDWPRTIDQLEDLRQIPRFDNS